MRFIKTSLTGSIVAILFIQLNHLYLYANDKVNLSKSVFQDTASFEDLKFAQISTGESHTCGITTDGEAYCWGHGRNGELGIGTTADMTKPAKVAGDLRFSFIKVGESHTCGITKEGGKAYCWGQGGAGRLGNGSSLNVMVPVAVSGDLTFGSLSLGLSHTCGITTAGKAYCWGQGLYGRLGNGSTENYMEPIAVSADMIFGSISAGSAHTCGLTIDGEVFCWGQGGYGRLGNDSTGNEQLPAKVSGKYKFKKISAGLAHTCGITTDNSVYCWGSNASGQLGNDSIANQLRPKEISSSDIKFSSISSGLMHTCGISLDGDSYCWGRNSSGQLGNNSKNIYQSKPLPVYGKFRFIEISTGNRHSCGINKENNQAFCWGFGAYGRLGNGSNKNQSSPKQVREPERIWTGS